MSWADIGIVFAGWSGLWLLFAAAGRLVAAGWDWWEGRAARGRFRAVPAPRVSHCRCVRPPVFFDQDSPDPRVVAMADYLARRPPGRHPRGGAA